MDECFCLVIINFMQSCGHSSPHSIIYSINGYIHSSGIVTGMVRGLRENEVGEEQQVRMKGTG